MVLLFRTTVGRLFVRRGGAGGCRKPPQPRGGRGDDGGQSIAGAGEDQQTSVGYEDYVIILLIGLSRSMSSVGPGNCGSAAVTVLLPTQELAAALHQLVEQDDVLQVRRHSPH